MKEDDEAKIEIEEPAEELETGLERETTEEGADACNTEGKPVEDEKVLEAELMELEAELEMLLDCDCVALIPVLLSGVNSRPCDREWEESHLDIAEDELNEKLLSPVTFALALLQVRGGS